MSPYPGDWVKQTLDFSKDTVFDAVSYSTGLHYQQTRNLFISAWLKGETQEHQYNLDFLIGYYFGAGNIIQISLKKGSRAENLLRESGYSITLKISYLLRI